MQSYDNLPDTKSATQKQPNLFSPLTKYVLTTFVIGTLLLTSVYITMLLIYNDNDDDWPATCDIQTSYQVDCLPGRNATYDSCSTVGCCWHDLTQKCFHSVPARHGYYAKDITGDSLQPRRPTSPLGSNNWPALYLNVLNADSEYVLINLQTREIDKNHENQSNIVKSNEDARQVLSVQINAPEFSITVTRANDKKIPLLTTARGPLIVTETYWELTLYLGKIKLYALDSTTVNGTTNWIYNSPSSHKIPTFLGVNTEGEAVGCYLDYKGPLEVQVLNKSNLIILRGFAMPEKISLHVFATPTPQQTVTRMFTVLKSNDEITINNEWPSTNMITSLGLHVCPMLKYIHGSIIDSINSLIKLTTASTINEGTPWDNHCIYQEFYLSLDKALNDSDKQILVESRTILTTAGKTLVPHLTPMVLTENSRVIERLANLSLLLENSSSTYAGCYGDFSIAYPNWSDNRTTTEFDNYLNEYLATFGLDTVIFIRDAWPRDDCCAAADFSQFDYMPQELRRLMSNGTIPFSLTTSMLKSHYSTHNKYANKFRMFVQGKAHLLGTRDILYNEANSLTEKLSWSALKMALAQGITAGLFGNLPPTIYVCGTLDNVNEELCARWFGAAVVFPYTMVIPEFLPGGNWLTTGTYNYIRNLLKLKTSLITYQRTVVNEYYSFGTPVLAPTYFHYPGNSYLSDISADQFFWGTGLLVGLVTLPQTRQLYMQIPDEYAWYHLRGNEAINPTVNGQAVSISIVEGEIALLVRPGYVIPIHENIKMSAVQTAQTDIQLTVNLACNKNGNCLAQGKIGYERGVFLIIIANETMLTLENVSNVRSSACSTSIRLSTVIKTIKILGGITSNIDIDLCVGNDDIINTKI